MKGESLFFGDSGLADEAVEGFKGTFDDLGSAMEEAITGADDLLTGGDFFSGGSSSLF